MIRPVTLHILRNTSRSKGKQTIKFGLVIEYNKYFYIRNIRNILNNKYIKYKKYFSSKNHAENEAGILVPDLLFFLKKTLYEVNASGLYLSFNIF